MLLLSKNKKLLGPYFFKILSANPELPMITFTTLFLWYDLPICLFFVFLGLLFSSFILSSPDFCYS